MSDNTDDLAARLAKAEQERDEARNVARSLAVVAAERGPKVLAHVMVEGWGPAPQAEPPKETDNE